MKKIMRLFNSFAIVASLVQGCSVAYAHADNSSAESHLENGQRKSKEVLQDAKKVSKKAVRDIKDQTCEMVNGKMECVIKKATNKVKNVTDEIKDKVNDGSTK